MYVFRLVLVCLNNFAMLYIKHSFSPRRDETMAQLAERSNSKSGNRTLFYIILQQLPIPAEEER